MSDPYRSSQVEELEKRVSELESENAELKAGCRVHVGFDEAVKAFSRHDNGHIQYAVCFLLVLTVVTFLSSVCGFQNHGDRIREMETVLYEITADPALEESMCLSMDEIWLYGGICPEDYQAMEEPQGIIQAL